MPVTGNGYDRPEGITSQSRYTLFRPSDCPNNPDHLTGTPARSANAGCCTTPRHNAHGTGIPDDREVYYAWHPWAGKTVRVHRVIRHSPGAIARCTAVEGEPPERSQELPVWMLDAAWCRKMRRVDEPVASLDALRALRALLGAVAGDAEETGHPPIRSAGSRPGERDASSPPPGDCAEPPSGSVRDESAHDAKLGAASGSHPSGPTPIRWTVEGCRHRYWGER